MGYKETLSGEHLRPWSAHTKHAIHWSYSQGVMTMMMQENFGGTVRNCVRGGPDHLVILETSADSGNRSQTT